MASYNNWVGLGRLTKDPELKFLPSGNAVCQFRLAASRKFKNSTGELREKTTFLTVKCWGKTAEAVAEYMKKGSQVMVEGPLDQEEWTGSDGQKRSLILCTAEKVLFLDSRGRTDAGAAGPAETPATEKAPPADSGGPKIDDDDIPF